MSLLSILLANLGLVLAATFLVWLLSLPLRDASIIDLFWGLGFVLIAWTAATLAGFPAPRAGMIALLASLWGLRLSGYLAWRNLGHGEDFRYRQMREYWGERFPLVSLGTVFWMQALIMWLVSFPLQLAACSTSALNWLDGLGAAIWLLGLLFETVGDWQLARFKAQPQNRSAVLDRGLWRYTRHPNYFGDFLVWWGFFLIAVAGGGWWTLFSPLLMSLLLMRVSGVTLLEKSLQDRRPDYQDYVDRTSAFFPWRPRTGGGGERST